MLSLGFWWAKEQAKARQAKGKKTPANAQGKRAKK